MVTIGNTYVTQTIFNGHTSNYTNPHNVTKAQIGLGNVDNTSDLDKPISNATQQALNNIIGNTPPIFNMTAANYRNDTPMEGAVYFTSNSFTSA